MNTDKNKTDLNGHPIGTPIVAKIGFAASMIGIASLAIGPPLASVLKSSVVGFVIVFGLCGGSIVGTVLSSYAIFRTPCRIAKWGLAGGLFGCMYIPTFTISLIREWSKQLPLGT